MKQRETAEERKGLAPPRHALGSLVGEKGYRMTNSRSVLWTLAVGICALRGIAAAEPIDITLCELVRNPAALSGKMVRTRAQADTGFEIAVLLAACDHKGAAVALYYPDFVRDSDRPDFSLLKDDNLKQFDQALASCGWGLQIGPSSKQPECRVFATLVGRFDGPDKLTVTDKTGKTIVRKGYGFTPSMLYQTRLILKSVTDVAISK